MSATIYVVVVSDRHCDDAIYIYAGRDAALVRARQESDRAAEHYGVIPKVGATDEWLFYEYIEDVGSVHVQASKLLDVEDAS